MSYLFHIQENIFFFYEISVCELKSPSMESFLNGLGQSGWLKHIKAIVDTSVFIAKVRVQEEFSIIFAYIFPRYFVTCVAQKSNHNITSTALIKSLKDKSKDLGSLAAI